MNPISLKKGNVRRNSSYPGNKSRVITKGYRIDLIRHGEYKDF